MGERGITNRELAHKLRTAESAVSRWRNGLRPGEKFQARIAKALDLTDAEISELGWEVPARA